MKTEATFTDLVQLHERKWGTTDYPGRPTLDQLLSSFIVVMWLVGKRFILSVHQDASEVNDLVFGLMTGQIDDPLNRKLARIFVNQESIDFRIKVVTATKPQEQASAPAAPRVSDNRRPTAVSARPEPQVVAVLPTPTPAFTLPEPKPVERDQPGKLRHGDLVTFDKPAIVTSMPDNRNIYIEPRHNPQFSKGLDRRLVDEINKRIK